MILPEKFTEEEIQFIKDNKNSTWMNLVRKAVRVAYTGFDYEFRMSAEHDHGFLAFSQGKKAGIVAVQNLFENHSQEVKKEEVKKPAHLVPK